MTTHAAPPRSTRRAWLKAAAGVPFAAPVASALLASIGGLSWLRQSRALAEGRALQRPMIERTNRPLNYETQRSAFTTRITPTDRFYIRNHFDLPSIDRSTWRLSIAGLVDKQLSLSFADLQKLEQVTVEAVLQCAGNGRGLFVPRVAGVQWQHGAMGNARWTGPRLKDVLTLAGPRPETRFLELAGHDRPIFEKTPKFIRGLPLSKGMHEDTIIALRMNDAPLSPAHGAPARLVVPGWVADGWMKWLARISLNVEEPKGFFYETAYRYPSVPGAPGAPVSPELMRPMDRLLVKSMIATPEAGSVLAPGPTRVRGVAFSGEQAIKQVEVSLDGGTSFTSAVLEPGGPYGFTMFELLFDAKPGRLRIVSRATDEAGAVQPVTAVWNPSGYLYNAIDGVDVEVRA